MTSITKKNLQSEGLVEKFCVTKPIPTFTAQNVVVICVEIVGNQYSLSWNLMEPSDILYLGFFGVANVWDFVLLGPM